MKDLVNRIRNYTDLAIESGYITEHDRDYFIGQMALLDDMTQELIYSMLEVLFLTGQEN